MQDDTFNGWTNWDTWNAHLWLSNDWTSYQQALAAVRTAHSTLEAEMGLSEALRDCMPAGDSRRDGKAWDGINFERVDWTSIRRAFTEELAEVDA